MTPNSTSNSEIHLIKDLIVGQDLKLIRDELMKLNEKIELLDQKIQDSLSLLQSTNDEKLKSLVDQLQNKETSLIAQIKKDRSKLSDIFSKVSAQLKED
jgi:t-SNARE complex subunit (syntaxin)